MSFSNRDFWRPARRKYRECRLCTCYSLKPFNNKPYLEILTQLSAGYMLFRYRTPRYYTASSREWKFRSVRSTVSTAFLVFSGRTAERDKFIRIVLLLLRVVVESCIYFWYDCLIWYDLIRSLIICRLLAILNFISYFRKYLFVIRMHFHVFVTNDASTLMYLY